MNKLTATKTTKRMVKLETIHEAEVREEFFLSIYNALKMKADLEFQGFDVKIIKTNGEVYEEV